MPQRTRSIFLTHIGGTNASNLSSAARGGLFAANTVPGSALVSASVTDTQLNRRAFGAGVYNWGTVTSKAA